MYCQHCMRNQERKGRFCIYCGKDLTTQNAPHQLPVGTRLQDRYVVGAAIGQGGFGITYIGLDLRIRKKIAIKEYFPRGLVNRREGDTNISVTAGTEKVYFEKEKKRFLQEAEILAQFSGERNIVGISDNFEEHNTVYIVMEFIDGIRLDDYLKQQGKLPFGKLFRLFSPLIQSLSRVHSTGLIHRDISPQNIMVLPDETLILLDFGAARKYGDSKETSLSVILKHGYSPSEQYMSHGRQGPWTDVYALCATMYRMLTMVMPPTAVERMDSDRLEKPSKLGAEISPAEEEVLLHGMALDIGSRIQSMEELHREFERASEKGKAYRYRGKNPQKKKKNLAALLSLLAVPALLVAGAVLLYSGARRKEPEIFTTEAEEKSEAETGPVTADIADVPEGFDVKRYEAAVFEDQSGITYYFDIGNNSGKTAEVQLDCRIYDAEGNLLDKGGTFEAVIRDGGRRLDAVKFTSLEGEAGRIEYSLQVKDTDKKDMSQALEVAEHDAGSGVVFTLKNAGEDPLQSAEVRVFFFDESGRVTGSDTVSAGPFSAVRPGEEWTAIARSFSGYLARPYHSYQYTVFAAERTGTVQPAIPADQFSCEKQGRIYKETSYIKVTNHSSETASVAVNAVAHDDQGEPVSAGRGNTIVLEPDESSVTDIYWNGTVPEDNITFRILAEKSSSSMEHSAAGELRIESRKEQKSLLTAVLNYGRGRAENCDMYVLFWGAEGELVHAKKLYLSAIELGETKTKQFDSPEEFDHADVYVNGYKNTGSWNGTELPPPGKDVSLLAGMEYVKPKIETIMENMDIVLGTENQGEGSTANYLIFFNKAGDYGGFFRYTLDGNLHGKADKITEGEEKTVTSGDVKVTLRKYTVGSEENGIVFYAAVNGDRIGAEHPAGGPTVLWTEDMEEDHLEYLTESENIRKRAVHYCEFGYADY